ncbi:MAG: DUF1493 family protein [Cytophagales bacterium]|nr:DUF1493 family protein [Cytophagales bacterium]
MIQNHIPYTQLKNTYIEVLNFTKEAVDWYDDFNASTRLEKDLSLYGDDNVDFLMVFSKRFEVDFNNMDYHKYLTSEAEISSGLWLVSLPFKIGKHILYLIFYPFSTNFSENIKQYQLPFQKEKLDITIGDLIFSVIHKEFTTRKQITDKDQFYSKQKS